MGEVSLQEAAPFLRDADLLLWRRRGLISIAGRGEYSHAAKFGWWGDCPMVLEVREWIGGRSTPLESQIRKAPGRIDVYKPEPWPDECYQPRLAHKKMLELTGGGYGYWHVLGAALLHLPILRLFMRADTNDKATSSLPPFCSEACAIADIAGGVDPVPNLANRITEPNDLSRSTFYRKFCTLRSVD